MHLNDHGYNTLERLVVDVIEQPLVDGDPGGGCLDLKSDTRLSGMANMVVK